VKNLLRFLSKLIIFIIILVVLLFFFCRLFPFQKCCKILKLNSYFGVDEGDTSYLVDKGDEAYANQLKLFELLENGKDYIVIKAPDDMSQSMSVTLPSEAGSSDYVLTWQDGNIMQWKDVSSISGISELIQVVTDFQKNGFTSVECVSGNCSYDGILDNIGESYPLDLDKGGLGSDLSSPSEDKILFYDESEGRNQVGSLEIPPPVEKSIPEKYTQPEMDFRFQVPKYNWEERWNAIPQ